MTDTSSSGTALAPRQATPNELARYSRDQIDLLKRTVAKGTTDDEFALFVTASQRMGLDPFARQIHAVKRWDKREQREVMAIQVAIDGYRLIAQRTGENDGRDGPYWCGADGVWRDVWLAPEPPRAAKVLVYRKGCSRPFTGVATYESYVQIQKDGRPFPIWDRMPDLMLAKCAEALALRMAFAAELGGTHTPEELGEDEAASAFSALPSSPAVAAPATTRAGEPARAAPASRPPLTEQAVEDILTAIGQASSEDTLKEIWRTRIQTAGADQPTLDRLGRAYAEQRTLIRRAASEERGPS